MDLDDHRLFVATVQAGSVTGAAVRLGLSRPTVSRRLAALEARLGVALLARSGREVRPTPAGAALAARVAPLLEAVEAAEREVDAAREAVTGLLRVSVPPVLAPEVAVLLGRLCGRHPGLELSLTAEQGWADVGADAVDVAVRAGRVVDPSLVVRRLGSAEVAAVAAPSVLASRGRPASVEGLAALPLVLGHAPEGGPQRWWPLCAGGRVAVSSPISTNDQAAVLRLAREGLGVGLVSLAAARADLQAGRLERVLPGVVGATLPVHAVMARRRGQPARVRAAVEALVAWYAARG